MLHDRLYAEAFSIEVLYQIEKSMLRILEYVDCQSPHSWRRVFDLLENAKNELA